MTARGASPGSSPARSETPYARVTSQTSNASRTKLSISAPPLVRGRARPVGG